MHLMEPILNNKDIYGKNKLEEKSCEKMMIIWNNTAFFAIWIITAQSATIIIFNATFQIQDFEGDAKYESVKIFSEKSEIGEINVQK